MSVVPYIMDKMLRRIEQPLYDQNFGLGLFPSDLVSPSTWNSLLSSPLHSGYLRPWRYVDTNSSGVSNIKHDKNGLKITLDVQQFKPEELNVSVVDDFVVIKGKHEERSDEHGFVSRQFTRRYKLPEDIDKTALKSSLSSDGVLELHAPLSTKLPGIPVLKVPIVQTNKPALTSSKKQKKGHAVEKMES